jgi:glycine/D-amino acid oxidase-like deaminating enzyme
MSRIVIVGGGCMGWATAYHLLRLDPSLEVEVVERDPTLRRSSTLLSDGNVRIQFNLEENIAMSLFAMETLETFAEDFSIGEFVPEPQMRKQGNLFLVDETGRQDAVSGLETQQRMGCDSEWFDKDTVEARFPALVSDGLVGGTFGPSDGSVDPGAVVEGYRRSAMALGAKAVQGEVESLSAHHGQMTGAALSDGAHLGADAVVMCAGAWSPPLLETVEVSIPVEPVMRTVYVIAGSVPESHALPSVFLPSGIYVIPEHDGTFLIAWSTDDDPIGFDFTPAPRSRFYDVIWPELASTLPAFDRLEVVRSWAGLYAQNRLDANAIIGEWPGIAGLFQATGFSGHGFQQCHAVGRHLGELITGKEPSLDLSRLGPERILVRRPLLEHAGRII